MEQCVELAKEVGASIAERFGVPVYLYEEASTNPARKNLEDIRRGEFEGLSEKMRSDGLGPGLRAADTSPLGGGVRRRRADAAHRL